MDKEQQLRILEFLRTFFDPEGNIYFLAVAAFEQEKVEHSHSITVKVRVALTFQERHGVNPYFDGTDLFVIMTPTEIQFTQEDKWADGPPLREGSPIKLALGWVSELALPFFISSEAQEA